MRRLEAFIARLALNQALANVKENLSKKESEIWMLSSLSDKTLEF